MLLPAFPVRKPGALLEAFLVSAGVVALAEFGDKTQLLALVLATRFRAPLSVIAGMLSGTLLNHLLAGALGTALAALLSPAPLRWLLAGSFLATALWMLLPERAEPPSGAPLPRMRLGAFGASVVAFFLAEFGDKTQLATLALAAHYHALAPVVAGSTVGMMLADLPAVFLGGAATRRLPMKLVRRVAVAAFLGLAVWVMAGVPA
jgi:putative Ca2+/H+ antiporter (TMEM165/GDT1 family)